MVDTAELRRRNAAFWSNAAPGWIRQADRQDVFGRPLGALAMDRLAGRTGERILDIGCGAGGSTAEIARVVGVDGRAVGIDLSASLIAAARRRFPPESHPSLEFMTADVETVDIVPGAPFDAAYSRMVLMLFADPTAGCTTIRRSLRPGGRLAATVFRDASANPWLVAALLGAAPHVGAIEALPVGEEPGPFSFADPARMTQVLGAAGLTDIGIEAHDVTLRPPDDPDSVTDWLIDVGPAGAAYRAAAPDARASARSGAATLLDRFRGRGGGYELPAGIWLLTATAPDGG